MGLFLNLLTTEAYSIKNPCVCFFLEHTAILSLKERLSLSLVWCLLPCVNTQKKRNILIFYKDNASCSPGMNASNGSRILRQILWTHILVQPYPNVEERLEIKNTVNNDHSFDRFLPLPDLRYKSEL